MATAPQTNGNLVSLPDQALSKLIKEVAVLKRKLKQTEDEISRLQEQSAKLREELRQRKLYDRRSQNRINQLSNTGGNNAHHA